MSKLKKKTAIPKQITVYVKTTKNSGFKIPQYYLHLVFKTMVSQYHSFGKL